MNIRDVLSLFERPGLRRWFGLAGEAEGAGAVPEAEPREPEADPGEDVPAPAVARAGAEPIVIVPPGNEVAAKGRPADQAVVAFPDPEITALRQQVSALKGKIADLSARRLEMEQLIQRFEYSQYQALGERLVENLRLRHQYLRLKARHTGATADMEAEEEAAAELDAYQRMREEGSQEVPALAEAERDELKRLYRAAAMRCHPDRVAAADQAAAHDFFLRTQAAYRQNDLDGLRLIHRQLAEGGSPDGAEPASPDREALLQLIERFQDQGADILLAIQTMQLDETYRKAKRTDDWEAYFTAVRELLEAESFNLKQEIRVFSAP